MRDVVRSVWREPRAPDPPRRVWRDWALVGVLVPLAVLEGLFRPGLADRAVWVTVAVGLLLTLLWRRTHPLAVVAVAFTTSTAVTLLLDTESGLYAMAALLLLPYALFRWGSGRAVVVGTAILLGCVCSTVVPGGRAADVVGGLTVLVSSIALGLAMRFRARVRVREFEKVKLLERERLARDLHDTVAHHVSAMAIRAQAGIATAATRPDAALDALRLIESEAASTLAEMRGIVRALRRDETADVQRAPNPGIGDVLGLARAGQGGPAVEVEVDGEVDGLSPAVGSAIYRLAQESVTNAVRHARDATRVQVRVTTDETSVRLRVTDDGAAGHRRPVAAPGYGISGMIERADLLGGTCEAGPGPERGWTVSAVLPRDGAPA